MAVPTDVVLVQAAVPSQVVADMMCSGVWLAGFPCLAGAQLHPVWSGTSQMLYLSIALPEPRPVNSANLAELESAFQRNFPSASGVRTSRLSRMFDILGASSGELPAFHYVVETDPETGWAEEIARWYDNEHMPGLAAVPGCVRASRYLNHDHGPLSYACYDLVTQETLGCDAWLAVRNTDWSSQMRPHFTNTRRTMFSLAGRLLDLCQPSK